DPTIHVNSSLLTSIIKGNPMWLPSSNTVSASSTAKLVHQDRSSVRRLSRLRSRGPVRAATRILIAAGLVLTSTANAQQRPPTPPDSAARDSTVQDTTRRA